MKRDSFILYRSFYGLIKLLKEKEQLKMYKAIFDYGFDGTEATFTDETSSAIWEAIKPQLRANNARYENGLKGAEYGKLGGRPKNPIGDSNTEKIKTPKKTPNPFYNETPNITPNENVNENVNENEKVSKKESKEEYLNNNLPHARESYRDIFQKLAVSDLVESKLWEFIQHCNLNGKILTNDKLEDMLIRLDMKYRSDDRAKITAIAEAISKGYYDVK